jgi:hypothetical protein
MKKLAKGKACDVAQRAFQQGIGPRSILRALKIEPRLFYKKRTRRTR